MIKVVEGDLLMATEDIIAHQVNCAGVMGSGVAKQIRDKYQNVFSHYKAMCNLKKSEDLLGVCQLVTCPDGKLVVNLFGQLSYGYDGRKYANTYKLQSAMFDLYTTAKSFGYSVAMPWKIGSDRGGADWNEVYQIIDEVFKEYQVTLYRFNG